MAFTIMPTLCIAAYGFLISELDAIPPQPPGGAGCLAYRTVIDPGCVKMLRLM